MGVELNGSGRVRVARREGVDGVDGVARVELRLPDLEPGDGLLEAGEVEDDGLVRGHAEPSVRVLVALRPAHQNKRRQHLPGGYVP